MLSSTCRVMNISKKEGRLESVSKADETSISMAGARSFKPSTTQDFRQSDSQKSLNFSTARLAATHRLLQVRSSFLWRIEDAPQ